MSFQPLQFTFPTGPSYWNHICLTARSTNFMQNTCQKITTSLDSLHVRKQIGAHGNVPNNISPQVDGEMNLIPMLANKVKIIPAEGWPLGQGHTILTSRELMWCYACSWDVRGDLTLNSVAQIHTSVTLLTSRDLTCTSGRLTCQHGSRTHLVRREVTWPHDSQMCATTEIWEACWHVSLPELHVRSRDVSRVTEVWICAKEFNVKSPLTSQLHA
jgi:hypothetical protein